MNDIGQNEQGFNGLPGGAAKTSRIESARRFEVAFNSEILYKAELKKGEPGYDKKAASSLTFNYSVVNLPLDEIAARIKARYNITSIFWNEKDKQFHRAKANFQRASFIGIDIDNPPEKKYLSWGDGLAHPFVGRYCSILYTTASHSPELHKFRLLFFLENPIESIVRLERIIGAAIWFFDSDEACSDASRFFYGAGEGGQVLILGNLLTEEGIEELLSAYMDAHPPLPKPPKIDLPKGDFKASYNMADEAARRLAYGQRAIQTARQMIYNSRAPVGKGPTRIAGNRHHTRCVAAYLVGGYIAGGLLSELEAYCALEDAVRANTDNLSNAMKTIRDGLEAGRAKPITFEDKERERAEWLAIHRAKARAQENLEDGEISLDEPISDDPAIDSHCRQLQANSSKVTRARGYISETLGIKVIWRLYNALHALAHNNLGAIKATNEQLALCYAKRKEAASSVSSVVRDKERQWKEQERTGIEAIWYQEGGQIYWDDEANEEKRTPSFYVLNLDRWTLQAIAFAIETYGWKYKDRQLREACKAIAAPILENANPKIEPPPVSEPDGYTLEVAAEKNLPKLADQFHEAWDDLELSQKEQSDRKIRVVRQFATLIVEPSKYKRTRQKERVTREVSTILNEVESQIFETDRQIRTEDTYKAVDFVEKKYHGAANGSAKGQNYDFSDPPLNTDFGATSGDFTVKQNDTPVASGVPLYDEGTYSGALARTDSRIRLDVELEVFVEAMRDAGFDYCEALADVEDAVMRLRQYAEIRERESLSV